MDLGERLSLYFTMTEGTVTEHRDIDNTPSPHVVAHMQIAALHLDGVRKMLGFPIFVRSWFRCELLNAAVGGSPTSDHPHGWAIDFTCPDFGPPLEICKALVAYTLDFDQLIEEQTWVHLSFAPAMRGQVLTKNPLGGYLHGLPRSAA